MVIYLSFLVQPTFLFPSLAAAVRGPLRLAGGSFAYRYAVLASPEVQRFAKSWKGLAGYFLYGELKNVLLAIIDTNICYHENKFAAIISSSPAMIFAAAARRDATAVVHDVLQIRSITK